MIFSKNKITFLSGAMGTEIQRRGCLTTLPLWSAKVLFEKPELVKEIHKDYIKAGADVITTNTFRTQRRTLRKVGLEKETERINKLAVQLATKAIEEAGADRKIWIAACTTTLEDCYRPNLVPAEKELEKEHREQAELLAGFGIDFFLIETMNTIAEAEVAACAARKTGKPFAISFVPDTSGDIFDGSSWKEAVEALAPLGPIAFLVNCARPEIITESIKKIKECTNIPFGGYGNGDGGPADKEGWEFKNKDDTELYVAEAAKWKKLGATIIGGCCGTNPEYTKRYVKIE
ncbi:MAG: homocysteine S-methyltransferase family protein [Nanoarchaeota archaeon]|nr:homocysteine S-methyltransferase family protein [Nanoarchaeota archaeon]